MTRPDVSIIIPTRERAETFEHCLRTITDQSYPSLEILVADNASTDRTHAIVKENADSRIRYLNPGKRLSMSLNWEFGLSHARGAWIGFIGDDDGLLQGGIEAMLMLAGTHGVRQVRCRPCDYLWPQIGGTTDGRLVVPTGKAVTVSAGREALAQAMAGNLPYTRLPTLYSGGFAHAEHIETCRGRDGNFFQSRIPDIYSAVRLTALGHDFAYSEAPFAINGISRMSTGVSQFTHKKSADAHKASRMFAAEANLPLHPSVPALADDEIPRSIHALLFECYQHVLTLEPTLPRLDPREQLRNMLMSAGVHATQLSAWAPAFAASNGFDDLPAVGFVRLRDAVDRWRNRLRLDRLVVTDSTSPKVADVHQASMVAADILAEPQPSPTAVAVNQARFALSLVQSRLSASG
jgi:hypothetical protein